MVVRNLFVKYPLLPPAPKDLVNNTAAKYFSRSFGARRSSAGELNSLVIQDSLRLVS